MSDLLEDDTSQASLGQMLSISKLWSDLRTYYLLLVLLVALALALAFLFVAVKQPVYTATAVVGPADNSDQPFGQDLGSAVSGLGGIAKHLHVGGALGQQGLDDKFDEYSSLLTSNRLAQVLIRKNRFLPEIFSDAWDPVHRTWLSHDDVIHRSIDDLKSLLHRPVKAAPDQDDLVKYFKDNLIVDPSLDTSFATVSLRFRDPGAAERLLGIILLEADNIIRQDKRRDVSARIAFLNTALEHLSLADQKPQLIDILSDQEQEMMMIESDHRYASTLIDTPHASLKPSSPSPVSDTVVALALAAIAWLGIVRLTPATGRRRRILAAFARGSRSRSEPPPLTAGNSFPETFPPRSPNSPTAVSPRSPARPRRPA